MQIKLRRLAQNSWALVGGMSGGKRNHENLSDEMALLEAALKARPHRCHARPSAKNQEEQQMVIERGCGQSSGRMVHFVAGPASVCRALHGSRERVQHQTRDGGPQLRVGVKDDRKQSTSTQAQQRQPSHHKTAHA